MEKKHLSFWQLLNMNAGIFGVQFAWGLQIANLSAIFEYLGANAHQIPILWLAAPITGLIVQPIIGNMSDNTWGPLGRRRPYFLIGALFSALALILMPQCSTLWMAVAVVWLLNAAVNTSVQPFRSFVGDLAPEEQQDEGFAMQSLLLSAGSVAASAMPWLLTHVFHVSIASTDNQSIPLPIRLSFYIAAAVFLGTSLWTIFSTQEYPPKSLEALEQQRQQRGGLVGNLKELWVATREMPTLVREVGWVQCFTWFGVYCFFLYFPPAVAWNIFGAPDQHSLLYSEGIEWSGICMAFYNIVCIGFSLLLPLLVRLTNRNIVHTVCLMCGATSLLSLFVVPNQYWLLLPMVGFGIASASILALPYAMVANAIPPERNGIYMGIFNAFLVIPQIIVSLGFGWVMAHLLNENSLAAVVLGGAFMAFSAFLMQRVETEAGTEISLSESPALIED